MLLLAQYRKSCSCIAYYLYQFSLQVAHIHHRLCICGRTQYQRFSGVNIRLSTVYSFHLILSLFRQQQQPIYVKWWWVWSQQSLQIYFNVTLVNLICSWNQSREQSCVAVCWCQIGVRAELKSPNLVSRELQLSSRSGEPVAANNSIRWNVLSQREQNITKIIGRLKYSNQILLYPWKHRYIISLETPQSRVQSNVAIFIAFLLAGDSKLKLQEEKECRLPWAKPHDEYCKAWSGDYEDIERMALQSHLSSALVLVVGWSH